MAKTWLLPNRFKRVGWILLIIGLILGATWLIGGEWPWRCSQTVEYLLNKVTLVSIIAGVMIVIGSRERVEDEMVSHLRLSSLLIALWISYSALIVATLSFYGIDYIDVMFFNVALTPLIFLAVFRWKMWRARKEAGDEE